MEEDWELDLPHGWWLSVTLIFVLGVVVGALTVGALWWLL